MEGIDTQAREDIGKLWYRLGELSTDYWGVNKDNGKRSELVQLKEEHGELKGRLLHYLDAEREQTCIGMKEFEKRDKFKSEINQEVTEVKTAEIDADAKKDVAKYQFLSNTVVQVLILAGVVFVAVFK